MMFNQIIRMGCEATLPVAGRKGYQSFAIHDWTHQENQCVGPGEIVLINYKRTFVLSGSQGSGKYDSMFCSGVHCAVSTPLRARGAEGAVRAKQLLRSKSLLAFRVKLRFRIETWTVLAEKGESEATLYKTPLCHEIAPRFFFARAN